MFGTGKTVVQKHEAVSDNAMEVFKSTLLKLVNGNEAIDADSQKIEDTNVKLRAIISENSVKQTALANIKARNVKFHAKINEFLS